MPRFDGRCVVVTGGGTGLGAAIAERFAEEGANVAIAGRRIEEGDRAPLRGPGRLMARRCDVTDIASVTTLFETVQAQFGAVDVLVNNAGVASQVNCVDMTLEEWDRVLGTNLTGTFLCCQAALKQMLAAERGAIVNVASQGGKRGMPLLTHYCASKAGVLGFSRALAVEVAPVVRVNSVCPGQIVTPMIEEEIERRRTLLGRSRAEVEKDWLQNIPLDRFQSADDVAAAVTFLASDEAKEITGVALNVSGGLVMD